eukprot:1497442-Rhodomonas_salina.1
MVLAAPVLSWRMVVAAAPAGVRGHSAAASARGRGHLAVVPNARHVGPPPAHSPYSTPRTNLRVVLNWVVGGLGQVPGV